MSDKLKLTNDVIRDITFHEDVDSPFGTMDLRHAIRELRDLAKAVCAFDTDERCVPGAPLCDGGLDQLRQDIARLREVLPS